MAINGENGVSAVTVDELLKQGLRIPNYQRPYSWDVSTALQLVDDISVRNVGCEYGEFDQDR